jgi:sodium/hydrogen exchanger 8
LRKTPSLETAFMLIFMYSPYVFAEAMHLSGIMAILFAGIVMSHYTHFNLSPVTRITVQQVFRTLAFIAETCVFAYLGLAIFSFKHIFKPSLVISGIVSFDNNFFSGFLNNKPPFYHILNTDHVFGLASM